MKFKIFIFMLGLFLFMPYHQNIFADAYYKTAPKKIKVTVTTAHLANLVNQICKDKVDVITIIPSTMCPSNHDIDPVMMKEIAKSNIILYHSWQQWVKDLKYKISNLGIIYREFKTEGNLMIPYINVRAAQEIKDLFIIWDSDNKNYYETNFVNYAFKVNNIGGEISKNNSSRYKKKVVCNNKIADFLEWLGFDVIAQYGKSEDMSSLEMIKLSKKIKTDKVKIIIDNLQVGTDIGRTLSRDLKLKYAVISNFPLGNSYIETLKNNIVKIDKVLQ